MRLEKLGEIIAANRENFFEFRLGLRSKALRRDNADIFLAEMGNGVYLRPSRVLPTSEIETCFAPKNVGPTCVTPTCVAPPSAIVGGGIADLLFLLILFSAFLWGNSLEAASPAEEYFKENCSSCHTIGDGELVGADLKGITGKRNKDWLVKFIVNAGSLHDAKDPIALELFKGPDGVSMPPFPDLEGEKVLALLEYISTESNARESVTAPASPSVIAGSTSAAIDNNPVTVTRSPTREITVQDSFSANAAVDGMNIFSGRRHLANGGPACIACHDLQKTPFPGGGNLGPDLSGVFNRLGKLKGLTSWLSSPPTPAMSRLFKKNPLKPEEIQSLVAAFEDVSKGEIQTRNVTPKLIVSGVGVGVSVLFFFGIYWRNRLTSVRRPLGKGGKI